MCVFLCCSYKTKGPWCSDDIKSRQKFYCDYCKKWKPKGMIYRWVDGLRSCSNCNGEYDG